MKLRCFLIFILTTSFSLFAIAQKSKQSTIDLFSAQYKLTNLPINSESSDFGLFPFGSSNFFFSSNRTNSNTKNEKQVYNWNNLPFLDIYLVSKTGDTSFSEALALPGSEETRFNEGPVFFDSTSNTFFITRNHYDKRKSKQSRHGVNRLKIYMENIDGTSFKSFKEFPYNNESYSVGHAAVSPDGRALYFSSDMEGGFGGSDIYVAIKEGEDWTTPKNLGSLVNTPGNELFPFISTDGKLYFSSNGQPNAAGLDIYQAEIRDSVYRNVKPLGAPFNSEQDDFSFFIYPGNTTGYFSSNRAGGKGDDDIYSFSLDNPVISGMVLDDKDQPMQFATVKVLDDELNIKNLTTDSSGKFVFIAKWSADYTVGASSKGYVPSTKSIETNKGEGPFELSFTLIKEDYGVEGLVLNKDSEKPIPGVQVSLLNKSNGKIQTTKADDKGFYHFNVQKNSEYVLRVEKIKFVAANVALSTKNMAIGVRKQDILLEELVVGKSIKVENVYYDLGKWNIRSDAKVELDNLVKLMKENPSLEIELSSHTDSRGSNKSNLTLSDKRAKAVATYVVSQGIKAERITGKGYGETQLLNKCKNGVKCSDEEHQMNRRTEFKILKM